MIVQAAPYPAAVAAVAYRYYRLTVTKTFQDPNPYLSIAELELRGTVGGADLTAPGMTVTADNSHASGPIANLIDNNGANIWTTITALPHWAIIDLGAAAVVHELAITARSDGFRYEPKDFVLAGSNDQAAWTDLKTVVGAPGWAGGDTKTFSF